MIGSREIIVLGVGQTGIQLSGRCWELLMKDEGFMPDGTKLTAKQFEESTGGECYRSLFSAPPFFEEHAKDRFKPRALLVDLEPTAAEKLLT